MSAASTGRRQRGRVTGKMSTAAAAAGSLLAAALTATVASAPPAAAAIAFPIVSAGGNHSCAVMTDQTTWCWGDDTTSQLGSGAKGTSTIPVQVPGLPPALGVAAGWAHSCVIDVSQGVWCWGSDAFGELGNGTTKQAVAVPAQVKGLAAEQISAGRDLTCAVTVSKQVQCWGDNNFGELGNGTTTDSSTPVLVKGLTNVLAVAAGYFHACALESNGGVWCWGSNTFGGLGNGTTTSSDVPVPVSGLDAGVVSIAAGADDSCAILKAGPGDLKCWGENGVGQLGIGTTTDSLVPAQVSALNSGVEQVTLGEDFGCARVSAFATVQCWGDSAGYGSLGTGSFGLLSPVPVPVFGLQIPPTGSGSFLPEQIAAGAHHACIVLFSLQLKCWGEGHFGATGNGTTLDRAIPTPVIGLPAPAGTVSEVSGGIQTGCAVTASLNAACWGNYPGDSSNEFPHDTSAVQVANLPAGGVAQVAAAYGGCALTTTGTLACWGDNTWGQIGNGTMTDEPTPEFVSGLSHVQALTTSGIHTCALVHNSGAMCWGDNFHGDLGDGTTTERSAPVAVQGLPAKLAQIAAGQEHTCALLTNQSVRCWGSNNAGQLGNNSTSDSSKPVKVKGLGNVVQIAAGDGGTCALTNAGAVSCWGDNQFGALGNGTTTNSPVPVPVTGLTSGVLAITMGNEYACAIGNTGQVQCWGYNGVGQLGDGSTTSSLVPVPVTGLISNGSSLSASASGQVTCGLDNGQHANCWGFNADGELGDGSLSLDSPAPVAVTGL